MFNSKTAAEKRKENNGAEYADFEICRKSKVADFLQSGEEFYIADMEKKKIYSSADLRLREISEKLDKETTFMFKRAMYQ